MTAHEWVEGLDGQITCKNCGDYAHSERKRKSCPLADNEHATDALKRIEEKHSPCGCLHSQGGMAHECLCSCGRPGPECDVVKLARALDHALEWMREQGCDCGTDEPGTCGLCEAERTLREVAGE